VRPTLLWRLAVCPEPAAAVEFLEYYGSLGRCVQGEHRLELPLFPNIVPKLVPTVSFDSTSDPPDTLDVLETPNEWHAFEPIGRSRRRAPGDIHRLKS
jgi:hypothetical protein